MIEYFEELELNEKHQKIKLPDNFSLEIEKGLIIGRLKIEVPKGFLNKSKNKRWRR